MELYLDTANVAEVERLARVFPLAGVTTNPRDSIAQAFGFGHHAFCVAAHCLGE